MFARVVHAENCFGGQYLGIVADLATLRAMPLAGFEPLRFPDGFDGPPNRAERDPSGLPQVVWGGASKGVIFALMRERAGAPVDRVIDINPAKQGRFLPCTGLRIMDPQSGLHDLPQGTMIHVMNPNYLEEIRNLAGPTYLYAGANDE